jgi:hypothetical protein
MSNFLTQRHLLVHLNCWTHEATSKKLRHGHWTVWNVMIWMIWKVRNGIIFNNVVVDVVELVESIKLLSWCWSMNRLKIASCLYYKWCWNPHNCLARGSECCWKREVLCSTGAIHINKDSTGALKPLQSMKPKLYIRKPNQQQKQLTTHLEYNT